MQAQQMIDSGTSGTILNIGSAAGLYPALFAPIYSASKGLPCFLCLII
jgi:short-subunit dehydrogenase